MDIIFKIWIFINKTIKWNYPGIEFISANKELRNINLDRKCTLWENIKYDFYKKKLIEASIYDFIQYLFFYENEFKNTILRYYDKLIIKINNKDFEFKNKWKDKFAIKRWKKIRDNINQIVDILYNKYLIIK